MCLVRDIYFESFPFFYEKLRLHGNWSAHWLFVLRLSYTVAHLLKAGGKTFSQREFCS